MKKLLLLTLLVIGTTGFAIGQITAVPISTLQKKKAPEIDPSLAISALALLSGGLLVVRGRRKK